MEGSRTAKKLPREDEIFVSRKGVTEQEKAGIISQEEAAIKRHAGAKAGLPPWLFEHRELVHTPENTKPLDQEALINTLNYIHFIDGHILVHLLHKEYKDSILVRAFPEPCQGIKAFCLWAREDMGGIDLDNYQFLHLLVSDGRSMILAPAKVQEITSEYLKLQLPDTSHAVGERQARRYVCGHVKAELVQSGFLARGELLDFSPVGFRIKVRPVSSSSFSWFNPDESATIYLRKEGKIIYSGDCRCVRYRDKIRFMEAVLTPGGGNINRFRPNQARNPRQLLVPPPTLVFDHPLLGKSVQLQVENLSTSGFSVCEREAEGVLIPGMVIPDMKIVFAGTLRLSCTAQVVHRTEEDENKGVRCGLAILDMDINSYSRLSHILGNALDPNAHITTEIDMNALWEFFFDTGFIYPKKYGLIQSHRDKFKETYRKLYQESPEIAKHFTYQRNGRISGHISMVRAYEMTWMIHHHAARIAENRRNGFVVLKQVMHYLNDMHRLPSTKMEYAMSYFRPENKFPDRVFGGFSRVLENPKGCSLDLFAYLLHTSLSLGAKLPAGWNLRECSKLDLWELNRFYDYSSGGLLLDAMGLGHEVCDDESFENTYARHGFLRKKEVYALTFANKLNAVLIVNQSDLGFNLSELLNGIKIIVTNPKCLPWNVLSIAISQLTGVYHTDRVPVLFYPFEYVQSQDVPYEKPYLAWVLSVRYGTQYMEYMRKKFRIKYE